MKFRLRLIILAVNAGIFLLAAFTCIAVCGEEQDAVTFAGAFAVAQSAICLLLYAAHKMDRKQEGSVGFGQSALLIAAAWAFLNGCFG